MASPVIAPFPPQELRRDLPPEEWQACLDAWIALAQLHLRLTDSGFQALLQDEEGSLTAFLISFFRESSTSSSNEPKLLSLRKESFLLVHRIFSGHFIPSVLLQWTFLADLGHSFSRSEQLRNLLQGAWTRKEAEIEKSLQKLKTSLIRTLDSKDPSSAEVDLGRLCHLLNASSDAGAFLITGSDFLDSLSAAYANASSSLRSKLVTIAYLGLISLIKEPKPKYSLLSDHLYSLKTTAEQEQKARPSSKILLADLVTNTPLVQRIRDGVTASEGARAKNTATSLEAFRQPGIARPKKLVRRKVDKGKGRAQENVYGHSAFGEIHVHRMSLVSQVQELFPDLGSGFVVKLLDEYGDNVEQVTAHLLENDLPGHLKNADRSEQITTAPVDMPTHMSPRTTPPPQRRNVFDNDEFDKLAVDTSRLHIGRKNEKLTADAMLSDRSGGVNKAAILSALAAFDSDDDERDDTYDADDVGGTLDSAIPGSEEADIDVREKNEEALFKAGKPRLALKSETGMTDEAIEGWGIMIGRDPRKLRRLETKFTAFSGQQRELPSISYRGSPADSGAEAEGSGAEGRGGYRGGRGGFGGRGRGRGGRGGRGGANVAGPADDKNTQVARQRKEASKGSRANHNRRDQRARKMARGRLAG